MTDVSIVASLFALHKHRLAHANLAPVRKWLAEGADLHFDILPVIKHWAARKPDIFSAGFFTPYVLAARDARLKAEKEAEARDTPDGLLRRAKAIAYLTRRLGQRHPVEERWLKEYEARHGAVGCGAAATAAE